MMAASYLYLTISLAVASLQPIALDLQTQLYNSGYSTDYTWMVRRNSSGSRLYLYEWPKGNGILIVEKGQVVKQIQRPAQVAYLNDEEQFVAWTDDFKQGVTFLGGCRRDVPLFGSFVVDPAGRYFAVGIPKTKDIGNGVEVEGGTSEIVALAQPRHILAVSRIYAQSIFANETKLYLIGWSPDGSLVCQSYQLAGEHLALVDEETIGASGAVMDMDPATERLLVQGEGYFFPVRRMVELHTDRQTRIGSATTLFLQPGVMLGSH
jgi:hypothetical protein